MNTVLLMIDHDSFLFRYGTLVFSAALFASCVYVYKKLNWSHTRKIKDELLALAHTPFESKSLEQFSRGTYTKNQLVWFLVELGKKVDVLTPLHIAAFEKLADHPPLKASQRTEILISAYFFDLHSYEELCELIHFNHVDLHEIEKSLVSK